MRVLLIFASSILTILPVSASSIISVAKNPVLYTLQEDTNLFEELSITETSQADTISGEFVDSGNHFIKKPSGEVPGDSVFLNAEIAGKSPDKADNSPVKCKRTRFYQKWWFSVLLLLMFSPWIYRYLSKKERWLNQKLKERNEKLKELKDLFKEREIYYEKREEEFKIKLIEEHELKYQAVGLSKFSDIISKNKHDLKVLGQQLITQLIDYLEANSGAIYLASEGNSDEQASLEILSAFAPDPKQLKTKFGYGEGYVGTCFMEGKIIELKNVPDSYIKVISGLGSSIPKYVMFVPLLQDEIKLGVIEIAAFKELEKYKIEFVEKLSQNIAASIAITRANEKLHEMLEQSRVQAEELRAQEEELRQNLEEMQTTQEDLNRQVEHNKKIQTELIKENALLNSLMNNLPDYIYFKDLDSKFIRISKSMLKIFDVEELEDMIGKSDFDFIEQETAQKYYDEEQQIIKSGKGIIDVVKQEIFENGFEQWSSITKMPMYNEIGECIGTFGITKDINTIKKLELESKLRSEELQSQEEELRQNLEEMQTIQEELQKRIADNRKIQTKLAKENALMNSLMSNLPEYIYFKDKNCRFIRISESMLKIFPVETVDEMIGKSDFDFIDKATAQKYYDEEQNIMKTGESIIDAVKNEVFDNGLEQWSSITKMPLFDDSGICIGTFGITKDITEIKKLELETKLKNEELQAQEEELRQNLEEMQTVQEELQRQKDVLDFEQSLMDAMMSNVPEHIYFKDLESKFIKTSLSLAKLFGKSNPAELEGKSDFDFFDDEHARPAYEDEQKIIKTKKPILNLIEKEVKKDGSVTYVNTSKMPLYDRQGKVIGSFGISTDITQLKNMEIEIQQRNEELQSQEEELRQNLEEMMTVQEEMQRQKDELSKEKALMDALLKNANENIYFKDLQSKFIKVSYSMAKLFNVKSVAELHGKSDFDFFTEEHARPAFEDEMEIIRTKKPIINIVEKETHADGRVTYVSTSKMPLYDEKEEIMGTFGISKDITEKMQIEIELKQRNEELMAQEEELRQNLEEMMTVQDDLERQREELAREKALMDALLKNATEAIYFKDQQSRFIKVSHSMAKLFHVKNVTELEGKSDFDYFTEEHAQPAYEDEMNIIKTKKPILNKIEKETHPDGRVTWVTTSKMPLFDLNENVMGTFGISKDITEKMEMEMELKQRNEELLTQEEELKQNLEEMMVIQEDLQKRINENEKLKKESEKREKELIKNIEELKKKRK